MDANAARQTAFIDEARIIGYPDDYVQSPDKHPMQVVADVITSRGLGRRAIGLELDAYYFSARAHHELTSRLPEARFIDASQLVNWVRVVKSSREIEYIRQAARIVEGAMDAAYRTMEPGVRQSDVAASIYQAQIGGPRGHPAEFGGTYTSSPPFIPTGRNTSAPHLVWTDARYASGDITTLELVGCRHRYHCPAGRTIVLGEPSREVRDTAEAVVEGLNAALGAIRPGVTCEAVERAWSRSVARHGIVKESRLGYSFGIAYPPTWGEQTLSLRPGDRTALEVNMTIHVIPGIWRDDWGIVITEGIRVTETGCEILCDMPRELFVKA
jgi:Xaa-Pro dipeptidase